MSTTPRAPDGYHYLGVAPVEIDAGGRAHVSRENLRFAPEFGGTAVEKGSGVMGFIGNAIGGALDFLSGNPDGDTDSDLADDFGDDEYIDLGYDDFGANNVGVVRAWMEGKYAQSGTMRTDGTNLWSYALLIGTTDGSGGKVVYNHRSSQTTNRHISLARQYAHAALPAPFGGNPDGDTDSDLADDFGKKKRKAPKSLSPKEVKSKLGKGLKGKKWTKGGKLYITFPAALIKKDAAKLAARILKKRKIKYEGGITLHLYGVFPAPPPAPFPVPIGLWRAQVELPGSTAKAIKEVQASKGGKAVPAPAQGALKSIPGRDGGNVAPDWAQDYSAEAEDAAVEERYQSAIQRLLADEFGLAFVDLSGNPDGDTDSDLADDFGDDDFYDFGGEGDTDSDVDFGDGYSYHDGHGTIRLRYQGSYGWWSKPHQNARHWIGPFQTIKAAEGAAARGYAAFGADFYDFGDDEYIDLGSDDDFDDFGRKMLAKPRGRKMKMKPRGSRRSGGRKRGPPPKVCVLFARSGGRRLLSPIRREWYAAQGISRRAARDPKVQAAWLAYMVSYEPQDEAEASMKQDWIACQQALGKIPSTSATGGDPYASYLGGGCGCGR